MKVNFYLSDKNNNSYDFLTRERVNSKNVINLTLNYRNSLNKNKIIILLLKKKKLNFKVN